MRHVGKLPEVHIFPGHPSVFGAEEVRMAEVRHRRIKEIGIKWMTFETRNGVTWQGRTGKVRAPRITAIKAAEEAPIFRSYINSFRILRRNLNCRNGTAIERRRNDVPILTVVLRSP